MDQRKTCIPFWLNAPKCLGADYSLKNRVIGVIAHGFGTFLYWVTPQLKHDTDLTIECLRRTILKYQQEKGSLPPVLYLQMDNASDNKSRRFFSFIAYLISKNIFQKIKVSFLVVGHTHEDIDGFFSVISRFFKKTLQQILTMTAFIQGLLSCSKAPPKCVEQIQYCYDCSIIEELFDQDIARFNLKEKTGDKLHYFLFWKDNVKGPVMQYKIYRSNEALYPRKYMPNCQYEFPGFGMGKVMSTTPERDVVTHEKFWRTKVCFRKEDGLEFEETFQFPANESAIQVFRNDASLPSEEDFKVADFHADFNSERPEIEATIYTTIRKCNFSDEERKDWEDFFDSIPSGPEQLQKVQPFLLPAPQTQTSSRHRQQPVLPVDKGLRDVDVLTHRHFTGTHRNKALKLASEERSLKGGVLEPLHTGDFVLLQVSVENCPTYHFNFVIAQVIGDVTQLDTTNPDTEINFQVFRPSNMQNLDSKLMPWMGDTNKLWKESFPRGLVKALVQVQVKGKRLTAKSLKMIKDKFF
jgi:hypothetical protein